MPDPLTAIGVGSLALGVKAGSDAKKAGSKTADAISETAAQSEALNRERMDRAEELLSPDIQRSDIAQQQLMRELGLDVPAISPYEQQRMGIVEQEGQEAAIAQRMTDRGIPEFITEKVKRPGKGRVTYEKKQVENPAYAAAYQEELASVRALPQGPERTTGMGMDKAIGAQQLPEATTFPQRLLQAKIEREQEARPGYQKTPAYSQIMGMYDEYGDVIGTPSYDDIRAPITDYQDLVAGDSVRAPLDEYQRMLDEGVDVTNLPGYQKMVSERLEAVNQGAAGSGSLYSGRRGEALAEVGGETQRSFATDYMNRQGSMATQLSNLESVRLGRQGQIAGDLSGVEQDRMQRFAGLTSAKAGAENQFYTNYMNLLQSMSEPTSATNIASMGVNQGIQQGAQNINAAVTSGNFELEGVGAQNAAIADMVQGATPIATAYMNQPPPPQQVNTPMIIPQQQGYTNPNFSPAQGNYSPAPQLDLMQGF